MELVLQGKCCLVWVIPSLFLWDKQVYFSLEEVSCAGISDQQNTISLEVGELLISGYTFITTLHSCNNHNKRSILSPFTALDKIRIAKIWRKIYEEPNY